MSIENITIDERAKAFILSTGNGTACLGFDVVYEQALELSRRLAAKGDTAVTPQRGEIGTLWQYAQYQTMLSQYIHFDDPRTWFDARTPRKVQEALEALRRSGDKARIFLGDSKTGRDWAEEFDTVGEISRSTGLMKTPLLGEGHAILSHCIVKLVNVTTGDILYQHTKYHLPKIEVVDAPDYERSSGFTHSVKMADHEGEMHWSGNFKSKKEAHNWVDFISGVTHKRCRA